MTPAGTPIGNNFTDMAARPRQNSPDAMDAATRAMHPHNEKFVRRLNMLKKLIAAAGCAFLLVMLTGCNTVQGLGKDIEKAGEKTQDAADAVRKKL